MNREDLLNEVERIWGTRINHKDSERWISDVLEYIIKDVTFNSEKVIGYQSTFQNETVEITTQNQPVVFRPLTSNWDIPQSGLLAHNIMTFRIGGDKPVLLEASAHIIQNAGSSQRYAYYITQDENFPSTPTIIEHSKGITTQGSAGSKKEADISTILLANPEDWIGIAVVNESGTNNADIELARFSIKSL